MISVFAPATALMRRLKYPEKFALVGALFILPLVVVLFLLLREVHHSTSIAEQELAGNQYLRGLRLLLEDFQYHRGLSSAVFGGASSLRKQYLETRVDIERHIEHLDDLHHKFSAALDTGGHWSAVKSEWTELRERNARLTERQGFDQHSILIAHVLDLVRHVGNTSKLLLDPELHSNHLMNVSVNGLPSLIEHIAQLRGWAGGAAARMRSSARDRLRLADLNAVIGAEVVAVRRNFTAAFAEDPSLRTTLEPQLQHAISETRSYLRLIIEQLMVADPGAIAADELWLKGTAALEGNYRLYDSTSAALDRIFEARVARLHRREVLVGSLTCLALLAVVYLFVGFYRGVMNTVHKLDIAAKRMAAGKIEHPVPLPDSNRDELLIVTRAFATLAARLRAEWYTAQEKRAEATAAAAKLCESEARTAAIMESAAEGIITIDEQGIVQSFNSAAKLMFGYSASEVVGNNISMLIPSPHREAHDGYLARYFRTGVPTAIGRRRDLEAVRQDGSLFPIRLAVSEMLWDGRRVFTGIITDLSIQRRREEQLREAQAAALEAARVTSEALANVSHAFRTPLNGILGMAELACDNRPTGEQHEFVNTIRSEAESLLSVLSDILDFSKLEAGELELESVPFYLREALNDTLRPFAVRMKRKSIELVCDIAADVPEALWGDVGRLRQIIVTLIDNAIRFTDQGETVVRVTMESEATTEAVLHFSISDTGIGIPPEKQHAVFKPFAHAGGSQTRQRGAKSGLGLTIASHLVDMMGGHMRVESTVGEGTTFHFTTRFALDSEAHASAEALEESALQGKRVLVVDPCAASREALIQLFASWRAEAVDVSNGTAALTEMQRAREEATPFGLVLIDDEVSQLDGFPLAARLREDPGFSETPLWLLTAYDDETAGERVRNQHADDFLTKPCIATSDLHDRIQRALSTESSEAPEDTEPAKPHVARMKGLNILLAEDGEVNRLVATRLLQKMGHTIVAAENGREALSALEQQRFDLVLMDVQMPEMDGLEATAAIRARERGTDEHIPIVALTAFAMTEDRKRCLQAGMDAYVTKPIQAPQLLGTIERLLRKRTPRHGSSRKTSLPSQIIDREVLSQSVGEEPAALLDLVTRFLGESRRILEELRQGVTRGDAPSLENGARRLKGSLREVAATAACEAALRLEAVARVGDLSQAADVMLTLEEELARLEPELTSMRNEA